MKRKTANVPFSLAPGNILAVTMLCHLEDNDLKGGTNREERLAIR